MRMDSNEDNNIKSTIKNLVTDPNVLFYELRKKRKDLYLWLGIVLIILFVYLFLSSGEFSFLLVISAICQTASFFIIAQKVYNFQNTSGLSLNCLICYLIVMSTRLTSTLFYNGYLPSDSAGDWFYQLCEIASLLLVIVNILFITKYYKENAENENDDSIDYKYLAIPALILALLVHTNLNSNIITDVCWSFSMYLEGVAIYPQLHLFTVKKAQIEPYTSHYVSLQGLHRLLTLIFWYYTYDELNEESEDSYSFFHTYTGYALILSQLIQLILMLDFYYYYFKSLFKGEKMSINSDI